MTTMPFPRNCPKCMADLTTDGAVSQDAVESGWWES